MNPEKKRKMSDEQKRLFDAEKSESHKDDVGSSRGFFAFINDPVKGLRGLAALFFDDEGKFDLLQQGPDSHSRCSSYACYFG